MSSNTRKHGNSNDQSLQYNHAGKHLQNHPKPYGRWATTAEENLEFSAMNKLQLV